MKQVLLEWKYSICTFVAVAFSAAYLWYENRKLKEQLKNISAGFLGGHETQKAEHGFQRLEEPYCYPASVNICLNTILAPLLSGYIPPVADRFYNCLVSRHRINTQCLPNILKDYNFFVLQYCWINGNKTQPYYRFSRHDPNPNWNYKVGCAVDLTKLFMPSSCEYTEFSSCEILELLHIIEHIDEFPEQVRQKAIEIRLVRNEAAHYRDKDWTKQKCVDSLDKLVNLINLLEIDIDKKRTAVDKITARKNGIYILAQQESIFIMLCFKQGDHQDFGATVHGLGSSEQKRAIDAFTQTDIFGENEGSFGIPNAFESCLKLCLTANASVFKTAKSFELAVHELLHKVIKCSAVDNKEIVYLDVEFDLPSSFSQEQLDIISAAFPGGLVTRKIGSFERQKVERKGYLDQDKGSSAISKVSKGPLKLDLTAEEDIFTTVESCTESVHKLLDKVIKCSGVDNKEYAYLDVEFVLPKTLTQEQLSVISTAFPGALNEKKSVDKEFTDGEAALNEQCRDQIKHDDKKVQNVEGKLSVHDLRSAQKVIPKPERPRFIEGSLCYLEENNKRWLLVGICLHTVISPVLRKLIKPKLEQLWQNLSTNNNIDTQLYPNHLKSHLTTYLNYESINNNTAFGLRQQAQFNYKVKNSVDLSKLFLETKMALYSDFDQSCDLSALLGILEKTGICSLSAKHYAGELRIKVRNTWAHCDYTKWDEPKYIESIELIENLVKNLGLPVWEEHQLLSDLEKLRQNGKDFIEGKSNVLAEVTIQVQNLIRYAESIVADNPEMIQKLEEQLVKAENTLANYEERIKKLEQTSQIHEHERQIFFKGKSELIETKLKNWKDDDKTFVATMGVKSILKCVEENKCVTITGSSGMGKTATLRHIVLQMTDKGYDIIPVNEPRDIEQYYSAQRKTMFIVDDFCGTFSANNVDIEKWKTFIDQSYMHLHNNVKLVVACRFQVFNDKLFQTLSVFKTCVCNLMSNEFKSSDIELQSIASMYLESEADKVAEYVNLYHCFPLLCKLYKTNPSLELTTFFQNPFSVYETDIDNMLAAGHDMKYCALMLCVIFNNALEESLLTGNIDEETRNIFRNVFEVCRLNRETSRIVLLDELNTLLKSFLQKEEGCYKTVHDKMFDFLSFYFGKMKLTWQCLIQNSRSKFIAERFSIFRTEPDYEFRIYLDTSQYNMYMQRLMRDWQNGDVNNVFMNTNMMYKTFRQTFLDTVKSCGEQLQQKMADTCDKESRCTALCMCCIYGDMDWLTWCFNHQIDVNKCTTDIGASPLYVACGQGHTETVTILLDRGADINKCTTDTGASPLNVACQEGHTETVTVLLDRGADINKCKTDTGASPLYAACYEGHTETVTVLLDRGADINRCTTDIGASPLFTACQNGHTETVTVLLDRRADIDKCTTNNGASPLYAACQKGHTETVTVLLDRGADINKCTTNNGASPLYVACHQGHTETVTVLLNRGADINKCRTDIGASPLYVACHQGHTGTVTVLLDRGADINKCTTNNGASPLHAACYFGFSEIVQQLISKGANSNIKMLNGRCPVDLAREMNHNDIVSWLETLK